MTNLRVLAIHTANLPRGTMFPFGHVPNTIEGSCEI